MKLAATEENVSISKHVVFRAGATRDQAALAQLLRGDPLPSTKPERPRSENLVARRTLKFELNLQSLKTNQNIVIQSVVQCRVNPTP